jgi:hypothetical protein
VNFYLVFSTMLFLFAGFIWTRKELYNLILKFVLFAMGLWGLFLELRYLGYIIHR